MAEKSFHPVDYVVFGLMLLISAGIGIYHGCTGGKQRTTSEYLLGNRSMKTLPIAISLLASYLSAITLLGVPSEIFTYGAQYTVLLFSYFILTATSAIIFVPILHGLHLTSAHEYLELRFGVGVRILGCMLFVVQYLLYLSVVLYAPALALQAVAGVPLTASIISTGVVCTFYTTLGGLKAVVWTDVFQAFVMVAGLITVFIVGTVKVGGFDAVWQINGDRGRLKFFDFNPDPTVRNTFWTLAIGGAFTAMPPWTVSQAAVQRFLASDSIKTAQRALWWNIPGLIFIVTFCCLDGLVIFAVYADCDLKEDKRVTSNDQVLPYFVIDQLGHLVGVPGIFMACLFSGALSTASSGLNSLITVTLEDIVKKKWTDLSDYEATKLSKILAVVYGVIIIGGAFIVKYFGTLVLQLAYSIFGLLGGPLLGIFFLGVMIPRANSKGAYVGAFVGFVLTITIAIAGMVYPPDKMAGSISIKACDHYNASIYANTTDDGIMLKTFKPYSEPFAKLGSLSYLWYSATAVGTTFVVGAIASFICETSHDRRSRPGPELLFNIPDFLRSLICCKSKESWSLARDSSPSHPPYNENNAKETKNGEGVQMEEFQQSDGLVEIEMCSCQKKKGKCDIHA
ncbi:sodium-coupled monocarboxylate transporter 1-like [Dendronephthya gigantea]|uniref:sodium-coupled monocarboxylate transporter 1-like n=1 Tax=Dendronephthya gigantea TaxID=151771 RepID=UPI00106D6030|nr:sodium-coupled monocarboxylate transporter 1-like [Dendronephthya gigantea]